MKCRFCIWLCARLCPPEMGNDRFWAYVYDWEHKFARDWEPWEEDEDLRNRGKKASALVATDPQQALAEFESLATQGFVWAMRWAGALHSGEQGVEQDLQKAEEYYYEALLGGSWMATLELSKLLNRNKINDRWECILEDGDGVGFLPASYWLGWYRYKRKPSRKTAREVRQLLEKAAVGGHPGARLQLAGWKAKGKLGLRNIPHGFRELGEVARRFSDGVSEEVKIELKEARQDV